MSVFARVCAVLLAAVPLLCAVPASGAEGSPSAAFRVPYPALVRALEHDIRTEREDPHLCWIELLAALAAKYDGAFEKYRQQDLDALAAARWAGVPLSELVGETADYDAYFALYSAVLRGFLGEYEAEVRGPDGRVRRETRYGLKVCHPIAAGFAAEHYDDFGAPRSYGHARPHLGHDIFGATGTPVTAVEDGVVEALGWNEYGGWRVGVRSFDGVRYYYYAHLRQNKPYPPALKQGVRVRAGDVIGYMGRTGYSTTENVNNIQVPHLHFGLSLSLSPDGEEFWIDLYAITRLLEQNRVPVSRDPASGEYQKGIPKRAEIRYNCLA